MKRLIVSGLVMAAAVAAAFGVQSVVRAYTGAPTSEAHIKRIRANCVDAQTVLRQLHSSDALLRVNQGPLYELISTNLMAPLNSRIALNRLNGTELVATTAAYEDELTAFRQDYRRYEEALSRTLSINCVDQPVSFFDSVAEARERRGKVHDSVVRLKQLIEEYRAELQVFSSHLKEDSHDE